MATRSGYRPYTGEWDSQAFQGTELIGIDFSNRCLVGADFSYSILKDCNFSGCDLSMAKFVGADCYRCDFSKAVLYAVEFDSANLTRARFDGSYTYGWLLNGSANVSYASMLKFDIEVCRRTAEFDSNVATNFAQVGFGDVLSNTYDICSRSYQVGMHRFTFTPLDKREAALQRSQVYNRLKRLYRENQDGESALHCYYLERHYRTRSAYRSSPLAGDSGETNVFRASALTILGYCSEFLAGYGVKPWRIVRNLIALFAAFLIVVVFWLGVSGGAVVARLNFACSPRIAGVSATCEPSLHLLRMRWADLPSLLEYCMLSMVNPDPARFAATNSLAHLALVYFVASALMLAMLFASVFARMITT